MSQRDSVLAPADSSTATRVNPATAGRPARTILLHPLLIAAYPVLFLYSRNLDEVSPREVLRPLALSLGIAIALGIALALATRHCRKAALATSATILAFFSYGHLANLLLPGGPSYVNLVSPLAAGILLLVVTAILRTRRPLKRATQVANLAAVALLAPSIATIGLWTAHRLFGRQVSGHGKAEQMANPGSADSSAVNKPDIYYIILDAYAGADSLRTFYGFDNSPFLSALEKRGFYIARRSRSNYDQTGYSLASSLNMRYLTDLPARSSSDGTLTEILRGMIDDNAVARELRGRGYRYIYVWTGVGLTRIQSADEVFGDDGTAPAPESFERQVFGLTALDAAPGEWTSEFDRHRAFIRSAFRDLSVASSQPSPKFVFAHISAPHPPFVFGANGEPVNPRGPYVDVDGSQLLQRITRDQYRAGYIAQLQYVNRQTLAAVDAVLSRSARPPVIILQGDHGSRMNLDWTSLAGTDLREPFTNLNAYLVPPRVRGHLYSTITPVNTFRIVFDSLFNTRHQRLPDRSYYSTAQHPLQFTDVTYRISSAWSSAAR